MADPITTYVPQMDPTVDFANSVSSDSYDDNATDSEDPTGKGTDGKHHLLNMFVPFPLRPPHVVVRGGNQEPRAFVNTTPGAACLDVN